LYSNLANDNKQYDFDNGLQHFQSIRNIRINDNIPYHIVKQPHILDNTKFFNIRRQLNQEQARIVKDILTKKKCDPNKPMHLFLIWGTGIGKTFTTKAIFQLLVVSTMWK
jgi:hypothetical protein